MTTFAIPASAQHEAATGRRKCRAQCPDQWTVECELDEGHDGLHRNNAVVFHWPIQVLVDGVEPDLTIESDHWQGGEVRLSWQEPVL